jgi:hypothetical protein
MTIQPDVRGAAQNFNLDPKLVQAVVNAEGDIVAAVRCSVPDVTTRQQALRVLCRSLVHAYRDYVHAQGENAAFVKFFGARWAPRGVANDPTDLNANFVGNVTKLAGYV